MLTIGQMRFYFNPVAIIEITWKIVFFHSAGHIDLPSPLVPGLAGLAASEESESGAAYLQPKLSHNSTFLAPIQRMTSKLIKLDFN